MPQPRKLKPQLGRIGLISIIFFTVSGGAYGLEPVVGALGAGWAVVLILAIPLIWCVPVTCMVSELASAIPEEGGYYVWVRKALGDFWGFQEGWWTLCYSAIDMAIYPTLFVDYLGYFYPSLALTGHAPARTLALRWLIAVAVIATGLLANWLGIRVVGDSSVLSIVIVLAPFAVITIAGLWRHAGVALAAVSHGFGQSHSAHALALGFAVVMWNYSGWDNVSTFAAEVKDAPRTYPFAIGAALILVVASYIFPVLGGLCFTTSRTVWSESAGWPVLARLIGGPAFGIAVAAVALVSAWALFNSQLLYVSRLPYAMACEGWFPEIFTRLSGRAAVPAATMIAACAVAAAFTVFPFTKLVVLDILLHSLEIFPEFLALIVLRRKAPEMRRPFRVPGGWFGLILITASPVAVFTFLAVESFKGAGNQVYQMLVIPAMILSGVWLYYRGRRRAIRGRLKASSADLRG